VFRRHSLSLSGEGGDFLPWVFYPYLLSFMGAGMIRFLVMWTWCELIVSVSVRAADEKQAVFLACLDLSQGRPDLWLMLGKSWHVQAMNMDESPHKLHDEVTNFWEVEGKVVYCGPYRY